jgi:Na+/proline symporter
MNNLHWLDIAVIIAYLVLCLIIGLYKIGKIKTIKDYTLGVGKISTVVLLFTIFATHIGAGATVGVVENLHSMGLIFAIALMFSPLFWVITAKICANNISVFKKAGCLSVSDIMGLLYGKTGKWVTNIFSILLSIGILALQIGAIGYLFNYFLGVSHAVGVFIGFGTLLIYSLFGGVKSVAITDTFQGIVLLIAIPTACFIAFYDVGGYQGLMANLPDSHLSVDFTKDNILLLASMVFYILTPEASGTFMQRFLMANNQKQLNRALKVITIASIPFTLVICLIGFIVKVKAPDVNPNVAFFYLINNYLPIGITGLLVTGILAAIMSTADSWLNTTSVLCAHDIYKGLFPKITSKQELFIARVSVLCIGALATLIALTGTSLIALEWLAGNFWLPVIFVPLAAGLLKFRTNHISFIVAIVGGVIGAVIGKYVSGEFATISVLFGVLGSMVGLFGTHLLQKLLKKRLDLPRIEVMCLE